MFTRKRVMSTSNDHYGILAFRCFCIQIVSTELKTKLSSLALHEDTLVHFDTFSITSDDNSQSLSCPTANIEAFNFDLHPMPSAGLSVSTPSRTPLCLTIHACPRVSLSILGHNIESGGEKITFRLFLNAKGLDREARSALMHLLPNCTKSRTSGVATEWLELSEKSVVDKKSQSMSSPEAEVKHTKFSDKCSTFNVQKTPKACKAQKVLSDKTSDKKKATKRKKQLPIKAKGSTPSPTGRRGPPQRAVAWSCKEDLPAGPFDSVPCRPAGSPSNSMQAGGLTCTNSSTRASLARAGAGRPPPSSCSSPAGCP